MVKAQAALESAREYLRRNPDEFGRAVRNAMGLRVGVPIVALRWLARQAEKPGKLEDIQIDSVPPGLHIAANVDAMKTPLRVSATLFIDRIVFTEEELTIAIRVEDIGLKLVGDARTPLAAIIKSGALSLDNIGTLLGYMPDRPVIIAEANENRLVLDLMRDPKIGRNPLTRRIVAVLTSFVTLYGVHSDSSHLDVSFRALPDGFGGAARALRHHLVLPSLGKLLPR
ncbi:MAG: hypothetical protein H5U40_00100 [Polyangiaceae bacterium]|nr:hypothetical protein [Polyangiaceae bacterium]